MAEKWGAKVAKSPLDVPGVKIDLTADAIVEIIREGRERYDAAGGKAGIV